MNALYYDIKDYSVRDFVGGLQDLEAGVLRLIGDPEQRFREDPGEDDSRGAVCGQVGFYH